MKSPVEWPVNAGGKEKPIDNTTAVASSDQVDVVCVGVVGLIQTCRYLSKMYHEIIMISLRPCCSRC